MDIKSYEKMAKLELTEEERQIISRLTEEMVQDLTVFEDIDTSGIEPLVSVLNIENIMREDVSVKMLPHEELLSAAPEQYGGYFQVPKTLE